MVTLPFLNYGFIHWCLLSGHLLIFLQLLLSSIFQCHAISGHESQAIAEGHLELFFKESPKRIPFCYDEEYSLRYVKKTASCYDLKGVGSLNSTCTLNSDLQLDGDLCITGTGNLELSPHVSIRCPTKGCSIIVNITGILKVSEYATIVAGSVAIEAENITLEHYSSINTSSLGGPPPAQTSGTPSTLDGAGGGHGGRGASCLKKNKTNWGGDVYAWSTLSSPWSYGSKGGSTSSNKQYGGDGGGRVMLKANNTLSLDGYVTAEGGDGGLKGGGGSGGSIVIHALKLKGEGMISAAGGSGWGGGGGGRISLDCYSIQDVLVSAHGGKSFGCPANAGAAGTTFDRSLRSLKVSNDNFSTETETPLLDFPTMMLWSNVFVESGAKVLVPLLWTRVQVRGQIRLLSGGQISFGLSDLPVSEFEMVAEELLMSNSIIKVYGAFRMYVKMLLMWDSKIEIDGGKDKDVGTSLLEVRNLVVLRHNSVICSSGELGVFGQGLLTLSGHGDAIRAQRVFLSLFYSIAVGPGALLQAPLDSEKESTLATQSRCESQTCPLEIIEPPDDCHVNSTMSFTLHICRVEDLIINGSIRASVLRIHRARTIVINYMGMLSASELGCKDGMGKGKILSHGAGGGAGHGGKGGAGFFNGTFIAGGAKYGDADLPCELGSGSGGSNDLLERASGGGLIVIGSTKWPLSKLEIYGSLRADGETHGKSKRNYNGTLVGGLGGGSGGTVLLFLQALVIGNNSSLSIAGGDGGRIGGGGGGGGRVHFDWSNIAMGDEYVQLATLNGTIDASGGKGRDGGYNGEPGTITGKACPEGLFGTFCNECPLGTFKDVVGSDPSLCNPCSSNFVPNRATFIYVRGGATRSACPYKCLSDKYKLPKCQTPLEELVYTFGGPWLFSLLLSSILIILACLLSALRVKLLRSYSSYQDTDSMRCHGPTSSPHLLSLAEVQGTNRAEETQSHVHRMYFMGPNTFREPWHLPYSPPAAIIGIVYEDAFNRFIDEINSIAAYEWWEGSIHIILAILAYPCSWSWRQWRRKVKALRLQEYVKSEYDHACLRSCRSRALYKGMKVGSTPDLMVAYIDFFLGGDEKHLDVDSTIAQRFPLCIIFGGNGSYMSPYYLHNDTLLTNLISQHVPATIWNRFVSDLNSQLRIVSQGSIRSGLHSIISWMHSDGNSQLMQNGVKIELGWFQATPSGYYQLGILVKVIHHFPHIRHRLDNADSSRAERSRKKSIPVRSVKHFPPNQPSVGSLNSSKRVTGGVSGGIINQATLQSLGYKRDFLFPFSLLLRNARPIGLQDSVQLIIAVMLLGDLVVTILMMFQLYWISLTTFLVALFILPLSFISPFPAGLYALLSRGPRRSSLARMYVLWNITSLSNIVAACTCGILSYGFPTYGLSLEDDTWNIYRDDNVWWILPTVLLIIKLFQVQFVNWHIANLEVHDHRALPGS